MTDNIGEPSPKRIQRERYHHGKLRSDLLRVARDEIASRGADDVSLASLARLAGVSQPAPYRHFADRKALLEAVATEGFERLTNEMRVAVEDQVSSSQAAKALASAYVRFGETNVEIYRLMFASKLTPEAPDGSELDKAAKEAFSLLSTTLTIAGMSANSMRNIQDVYGIWAHLHGLVMLKADGFIVSSLDSFIERA